MNAGSGRAVPRPFKLHWGEGQTHSIPSLHTSSSAGTHQIVEDMCESVDRRLRTSSGVVLVLSAVGFGSE